MPDLTVIIPARNEMFLKRTVESVLAAITSDTHIIIVADGNWPDPPIEDHPRVHMIHHSTSIGQRAATNEGVLLAQSRYVMKLDAHCDVAHAFDTVLLRDIQPDWTMVPTLRNLHAFDWVCPQGHRRYQGPDGPCAQCGQPTTRDVVWIAKQSPQSTSFCFDETPHFQYFREWNRRPDGKGEITETMSLQGSCFMLSRDRYLDLDICDEEFGSWGSQGIEVAVKSWLSGGRVVVNRRTYIAHMFRTQGGSFGFPYPLSGNQVERAKRRARDLFFTNSWPKQTRPLSWLLDRFWPVPGWSDEARVTVMDAGLEFTQRRNALSVLQPVSPLVGGLVGSAVGPNADHATPVGALGAGSIGSRGEGVPVLADSRPSIDGGRAIAPGQVLTQRGESEMGGVAATRPLTDDMIQLGDVPTFPHGDRLDEPGVHEPVGKDHRTPQVTGESDRPIAGLPDAVSSPQPASSFSVNVNLGEQTRNRLAVKVGNREILDGSHGPTSIGSRLGAVGNTTLPTAPIISRTPTKSIIYYTDNRPDPALLAACQRQLDRARGQLPVVAVSLLPLHWSSPGVHPIVVGKQRGIRTMFEQILLGLETSTADIVFFCEHDLLYHPTHFEFTPERTDAYYYNTNTWKVDALTGQALYYLTKQTSGLCGYRDLLIRHYTARLAKMAQNEADLTAAGEKVKNDGFSRHMGFEPGCHQPPRGVDSHPALAWTSPQPNIDIRHQTNLTSSRWSQSEFRDPKSCLGWTLSDQVPGWGTTKGRFKEFLAELDGHNADQAGRSLAQT